jgi:hypothetical protein
MALVKDKCALNVTHFNKISRLIETTIRRLEAMFLTFPDARSSAGSELMSIAKASFEKQPMSIAKAYGRLGKKAEAHEKEIKWQHSEAKIALKKAEDRQLKLVMEDAKTFFAKLFG